MLPTLNDMKTTLKFSILIVFLILGSFASTYGQVQLISPNGGENWKNNTTETVIWSNQEGFGEFVLEFSPNNGAVWYDLQYIYGSPGLNELEIFVNFQLSDQAKIKIRNYASTVFDESDSTFSVSNFPYVINPPSPGQIYYQNSGIFVNWYSDNNNPVNIDFSSDNGISWSRVGSGITSAPYTFNAPEVNSAECKVMLSDAGNPEFYYYSAVFSVLPLPEITVVSPNGGEVWNYGQYYTVSWSGSGLGSYVSIEYSSNGGVSWQSYWYGESSPTGGSYQIQAPSMGTENARIKISNPYMVGISDISDDSFTVVVPPFVINSPTAGNTYYAGQPMAISWFPFDTTNVDIGFSTDNGITFETLASNIPSAQSYIEVNTPSVVSENCIVRIAEVDNPLNFALSDVIALSEPPLLTILSPDGGEIWDNDSTYTIQWAYTGVVPANSYLNIDFSSDNGNNWENIAFLYYYENENSFSWTTPQQTSDSCLIRITDYYYPFITDESQSVFSIKDIPSPNICMVSVDSVSGKNIIIWNRVESELISEYVILKEGNEANVYQEIGSVAANGFASFVDNESNPREKATRYKLSFRDSYANLYGTGSIHQTIHLSISQGVGNTWNLSWNPYLGFPVSSYTIYRGSNPAEMQMLTTVSGNFTSFTDLNAQAGYVYYMIEVINPGGSCNPDGFKSTDYSRSASNIATNNILGIDDKLQITNLTVY
ncbi:MAG: hypothetical protein HGA37_10260, partial [Lentimicrobium sp.]|nr:hypothetical protein [Lentimicrobium sp.]